MKPIHKYNNGNGATPVLELETDDNLVIKIDCYYEQNADN